MGLDFKQRLVQSRQLLRLQEMRVEACEKHYREAQQKRQQAQQEVDERRAAVDALKAQRQQLQNQLEQPDIIGCPRLQKIAHTRRYWIDYDLERDEYYLQMDEDALEDANNECIKMRQDWLNARSKTASAQSLVDAVKQAITLQQEHRNEREADELFTGREIV